MRRVQLLIVCLVVFLIVFQSEEDGSQVLLGSNVFLRRPSTKVVMRTTVTNVFSSLVRSTETFRLTLMGMTSIGNDTDCVTDGTNTTSGWCVMLYPPLIILPVVPILPDHDHYLR